MVHDQSIKNILKLKASQSRH